MQVRQELDYRVEVCRATRGSHIELVTVTEEKKTLRGGDNNMVGLVGTYKILNK
jgi:hypothetical protein